MAYSHPFLLITWNFAVINTDEQADTTLHVAPLAAWTNTDAIAALGALTSTNLTAISDAMATLMGSSALLWASYSRHTYVKVAAVDREGHYLAEARTYERPTAAAGVSTAPQIIESVVLSLRSGQTLGDANRGRMYLPHCRQNVILNNTPYQDGQLATAQAGRTMLNAVKAQLASLPAPSGQVIPMIMSRKGTYGYAKAVTRVGCDNVIDVQRRRKNRLNPTMVMVNL